METTLIKAQLAYIDSLLAVVEQGKAELESKQCAINQLETSLGHSLQREIDHKTTIDSLEQSLAASAKRESHLAAHLDQALAHLEALLRAKSLTQ